MTPEQVGYRDEVKKVLIEFLTQFGYPDMTLQEVMSHLPNMYRTLEEKQLVKYGLTWQLFEQFAVQKANQVHMDEQMATA
jgi:hypothetical protein